VQHTVVVPPNSAVPPRLLKLKDAANYLGKSTKEVRALIFKGELPFIKGLGRGGQYLLDLHDLDEWIELKKTDHKI